MQRTIVAISMAAAVTMAAHADAARAASRDSHGLRLACENGRSYPIEPSAISDEGDLVTGYVTVNRGQRVPIRLIPMGEGYRYAGRGIWIDGMAGDAVLNWQKRRAVACMVQHG